MEFHTLIISNDINIKVLYQDKDIMVIDKPCGLIVNDSETVKTKTLQQIIGEQNLIDLHKSSDDIEEFPYNKYDEFINRQGIVHRLDADTSGVLVIARTIKSFVNLQNQFKDRLIKKGYIAFCKGVVKDLEIGDEFEVDAPIKRNPKSRRKFAVVEDNGKEAKTDFKLINILTSKNSKQYSLYECYPYTGRTHQIRVHLAAMNIPVVGDKLYSSNKSIIKDKNVFTRMCLHAFYIKFKHPATGKCIEITSTLPKEFEDTLKDITYN